MTPPCACGVDHFHARATSIIQPYLKVLVFILPLINIFTAVDFESTVVGLENRSTVKLCQQEIRVLHTNCLCLGAWLSGPAAARAAAATASLGLRAAMVQEASCRIVRVSSFHFKSSRCGMDPLDIGGSMGTVPVFRGRNPCLTDLSAQIARRGRFENAHSPTREKP